MFYCDLLLDPDMLEVGNGGMTTEEYRSHFSIWALAKVYKFMYNTSFDCNIPVHLKRRFYKNKIKLKN